MLRAVAAVSLVYDTVAGIFLLFFRTYLEQSVGLPQVQPAIYADLNGIFLITDRNWLRRCRYAIRCVTGRICGSRVSRSRRRVPPRFSSMSCYRGGPGVRAALRQQRRALGRLTLVALRRHEPAVVS